MNNPADPFQPTSTVKAMFAGRGADQAVPTPKERLRAWFHALRPPFLIVDLIPVALGLALAVRGEDGHLLPGDAWPWGRALLVLIGCFLVHTVANIANDLFDHIQGADGEGALGGTGIIQSGAIPPRTITLTIILFMAAAACIAYGLMQATGQWWLTGFIAFAALSSVFYVAPPIKYGYRGYGELMVALNMGFIMTCGSQVVFSGGFDPKGLSFGLIVGLMVAGILYYQSLPDVDTDRASGKFTLAVRLGRERSRLVFDCWWPLTWILMANLWAAGLCSAWIFLGCLTIPLFISASRKVHAADTPEATQALDAHGHLVRKLYLLNGFATIIGAFTV